LLNPLYVPLKYQVSYFIYQISYFIIGVLGRLIKKLKGKIDE